MGGVLGFFVAAYFAPPAAVLMFGDMDYAGFLIWVPVLNWLVAFMTGVFIQPFIVAAVIWFACLLVGFLVDENRGPK